jgi:hypothetical protein
VDNVEYRPKNLVRLAGKAIPRTHIRQAKTYRIANQGCQKQPKLAVHPPILAVLA